MFVLPLAPSPAMIAYDGACYTVDKNADGFVEAKDRDVEVFNEFQFLLAQKNVYYGPNASAHGLADAAKYAAAEMEGADQPLVLSSPSRVLQTLFASPSRGKN